MVRRPELVIATNNRVYRWPENNNSSSNNSNNNSSNNNNNISRNKNNRRINNNQDSIDVITTTTIRVTDPDPTTELVSSTLRVNNNSSRIARVS